MCQHTVVGKDLSKHHCNACHENFYVDADGEEAYHCPFCGGESVYRTATWWVLAPVDKTRMDDNILVTPAVD